MAAPSILTAPAVILSEATLSTNAPMPASFAAGSNRGVFVHFLMYNGGGTTTAPTAPVCNGRTPIFVAGDTTARTRVACSTWFFTEADIPFLLSQDLVCTTGATGSQKTVAVTLIQDCPQILMPTDAKNGYTDTTATITLSLTRAANSITFAYGFNSVASQSMTFTDPTRVGTNNLASRRGSYGYATDTARTANFTSLGGTYSSVHAFNIPEISAQSITDVNGDDTVSSGSVSNVANIVGFPGAVIGGNIDGISLINVVDNADGTVDFDVPDPVHGEVFPEIGVTQLLTLTDGTNTASINITFNQNAEYSVVTVADPELVDDTYLGPNLEDTPVNGDVFWNVTADCTVSATGEVSTDAEKTTTFCHWIASSEIIKIYSLTINEFGVAQGESSIVSRGIVARGIVARSIVVRGL